MSKIFLAVVLFVSLSSVAQTDTSAMQLGEQSDSTGFGVPDGKAVSQEIGAAGGRITSADGVVQLIFPAGALENNTTISIQPTTPPFTSATGKSYHFEPSGIQFKKPVQLIFRYSDEEARRCPPELMSLGVQNRSGKWSFLYFTDWDSTAKTLIGLIHHFSRYTKVADILLEPSKTEVAVTEQITVLALNRRVKVDTGTYAGQHEVAFLNAKWKRLWYANGIEWGDNENGYLSDAYMSAGKNTTMALGRYLAPNVMPKRNPVAIALIVEYYSPKRKKNVWGYAVCDVQIYDVYRVSVAVEFELLCGAKFTGTSKFNAKVYPNKVVLSDVQNRPPQLTRAPGCKTVEYLTDGCIGPVHINSELLKHSVVTPGGVPQVRLEFTQAEVLQMRVRARAGGYVTPPQDVYTKSLPPEIQFVANGRPHHTVMTAATFGTIYAIHIDPLR